MAPRRPGHSLSKKPGVNHISAMAQSGGGHLSSKPKTQSIVLTDDTFKKDTSATKQTVIALAEKVVLIEERTAFLGDLITIRRGTREVERFIRKQEGLRHEEKKRMSREDVQEMMLREREAVMDLMRNKLQDNISKGVRRGKKLLNLKMRLFWG